MSYNPHLDQPLGYAGAPLNQARGAVIAMHGRDWVPEDILSVCRRIGLDDIAWLAPAAHENTWYPNPFTAPLEDNEPSLSWTLERIQTLVDEVMAHGIAPEHIVLLGFSQGACAVAEYAVRHARRYGGIVIFTGGVMGPSDTQRNYGGGFAGTPAFVGGSREDEWISEARMRETCDLLRSMGAEVSDHFYSGCDHFVTDAEVTAARVIIQGLRAAA